MCRRNCRMLCVLHRFAAKCATKRHLKQCPLSPFGMPNSPFCRAGSRLLHSEKLPSAPRKAAFRNAKALLSAPGDCHPAVSEALFRLATTLSADFRRRFSEIKKKAKQPVGCQCVCRVPRCAGSGVVAAAAAERFFRFFYSYVSTLY